MGHWFVATMIGGDLEGCGPSQPLPAVNWQHFTAPTERPPSRESASNGHSFVATMIGGGMEGCGPSQPLPAVNWQHFTAPTERPPSRGSASNGPLVRGNDDRWRLGRLRSLAAVAGRKLATFHGADGAAALQGIGQHKEIVAPEHLMYTWQCGCGSDPAVEESLVTVDFIDLGVSTEVRLRHELLPNDNVREDHKHGWIGTFEKLEKYLGI
jgi:uncharacterized protein YndB with AHSA1/START domain